MTDTNQTASAGQGLAITSLVLGLVALFIPFVGGILGVVAIVLGIVVLKRRRADGKAIAGIVLGSVSIFFTLVILLVFMAVPSLQSNSRDTARKNDVANIAAEVMDYESNNSGKLPSKYDLSTSQLVSVSTIKETDHEGIRYDGDALPTKDTAVYAIGENCDGQQGAHNFTVTVMLESNTLYCTGS